MDPVPGDKLWGRCEYFDRSLASNAQGCASRPAADNHYTRSDAAAAALGPHETFVHETNLTESALDEAPDGFNHQSNGRHVRSLFSISRHPPASLVYTLSCRETGPNIGHKDILVLGRPDKEKLRMR